MIEAFVGILILLVALKLLFWVFVLLFSPLILIGGILLSIFLLVFLFVGGAFLLLFKILLLPLLLILLWPFCWSA